MTPSLQKPVGSVFMPVQAQRDVVRAAEAEALMQAGDPVGAACLWGKMAAANPPFEDIALRLVDCGSPDALHILLSTKLDALPSSDRAQVCPHTIRMQCTLLPGENNVALDVTSRDMLMVSAARR